MKSRQFYVMKFKSSRLKEFKYNIENLTLEQAKDYGEIIALFDNQFLRTIRRITNQDIDMQKLDQWYAERDILKKQRKSTKNSAQIEKLRSVIDHMMFIPEYITIVMEHPAHYKYLHQHGLQLNGKRYIRLSCSAGQARSSTVVFCEEQTCAKLISILDNGRNLSKPLTPSKYNAYLGLYGSATKVVSPPRFCVVPDYHSPQDVQVNYVTETTGTEDDMIDVRTITEYFNRFDGQGLIMYEKAKQWSEELQLDYVPSTWCIRQSFMKGMLCTFPIHEFCEKYNNGSYIIQTSYKNEDGTPKLVDLRNIDVILTESQFKLWDSFDSSEIYEENCRKNELHWGVSLFSPKQDNDILKLNYQFLQTLNLDCTDIEDVCRKFVDWISGVTLDNIYYTLLFLLGRNAHADKIADFLQNSENYWVKSLIMNHDLIKDPYIQKKIYDLIKTRINQGALGQIIVDGNFQTIISDPFAFMQHACGLPVTGLLGRKQYYSHYWNQKNVKIVNSMRAPLTYRSEHVKLNLIQNEMTSYWYRYCYSGIIVNVFGEETMKWAGSDFDYDILATTSDATIIKGIYEAELPVAYEAPKPQAKQISEEDLYQADLFAFGSIIGSITNKSTSAYALLPNFEPESNEHCTLLNRLKMCTKLQSAQIDKAKIGRNVKGIPDHWTQYDRIQDHEPVDVASIKRFHNSILLNKYPYFFIYLYKDTKNKYAQHVNGYELSCQQKYGIELQQLIEKENKTDEEREFVNKYKEFMPVIDSDCVMNMLCKHIEAVHSQIKNKHNDIKIKKFDYHVYLAPNMEEHDKTYLAVKREMANYNKLVKEMGNIGALPNHYGAKYIEDIGTQINNRYELLKNRMNRVCSNESELVNYLIRLFYEEKKNSNKDVLWNTYGDVIFENVKHNRADSPILFPSPSPSGDIKYLNKTYSLKQVTL